MNFRKLISAALLISLITVAMPTPLDSKAKALSADYLLLVPAAFFALTVAATGAKIYYAVSNTNAPKEQYAERQNALTGIAMGSGVAAFWTLTMFAQAVTEATKKAS